MKKIVLMLILVLLLMPMMSLSAQRLSEKPYSMIINVLYDIETEGSGKIKIDFIWYGAVAKEIGRMIAQMTEKKFLEYYLDKVKEVNSSKSLIGGTLEFSLVGDPRVLVKNESSEGIPKLELLVEMPVKAISGKIVNKNGTKAVIYSTYPEDSDIYKLYSASYDVFNLTVVLPKDYKVNFVLGETPSMIYPVEEAGAVRVAINWFTVNPYASKYLTGQNLGTFKVFASTSTKDSMDAIQKYRSLADQLLHSSLYSYNPIKLGESAREFFKAYYEVATLKKPLLRYKLEDIGKFYQEVVNERRTPMEVYILPASVSLVSSLALILYYYVTYVRRRSS